METIYWSTEVAHADNSETMVDFMENVNMLDITLVDGTYAEGVNCNGEAYGIHVSGDGDCFNHKAEFELLNVKEEVAVMRNADFGQALEHLKAGIGNKAWRADWEAKGMWMLLTPGRVIESCKPDSFYDKCGFEAPVNISGHFDMRAENGSMIVGCQLQHDDLLAEDWCFEVLDNA
jgi:hypothetical protein